MRCPLCEVAMKEVERQGVSIDVCPECRGVWLDRGELDKLLKAEVKSDHDHEDHRHPKHKKKKSWLSELLDFD